MAKNFIQDGDTIEHVAVAAITSGDVVVVGNLVCIALFDAAIGETVVLRKTGVWQVPKTSAGAIAQGEKVDYDVSSGEFAQIGTAQTGDIVGCGIAHEAAADGDTVINVLINEPIGSVTP